MNISHDRNDLSIQRKDKAVNLEPSTTRFKIHSCIIQRLNLDWKQEFVKILHFRSLRSVEVNEVTFFDIYVRVRAEKDGFDAHGRRRFEWKVRSTSIPEASAGLPHTES
ncbi:hypothetical protein CYMTET_45868 [Cymbomonas tetramitiformis]|uniref:Uncharacterized protein n=1 Tax=Cymbomonas tetramitiformis TaxID=36881 RepID=A0AAE0BYR1_9CHLO|nr:hypothetical protein CYMTET_45868 [Cymbomonas tetramitiformis]